MVERKSRLVASAAFGNNEVGRYSRSGDIPLRWKHVANFTYMQGSWSGTLSHIYSAGYTDAQLPGVANGSIKPVNYSPNVKAWSTFNLSGTYSGMKNLAICCLRFRHRRRKFLGAPHRGSARSFVLGESDVSVQVVIERAERSATRSVSGGTCPLIFFKPVGFGR
jgi:hypothetical protein